MNKPSSQIFLFNAWVDNTNYLLNKDLLKMKAVRFCRDVGLTIVSTDEFVFPKTSGITMTFIIAESSLSIHTWPEMNYIRIVLDSCKALEPLEVSESLRRNFEIPAERSDLKVILW